MSKHKWLIAALIVGGLIATIMLLWPLWQTGTISGTEASQAPDFGSTIRVENPRIMLPERAGDGARIYLDITNVGDQTTVLSEVRLAHASATGIQEIEGPAWMPVANLPIEPGETLSLNPDGEFAVVSNYDSNVVPGAMIDVSLVFGTSATITVPAQVFKAV
ncbi:copper chaperone PCu(A)C [Erythrobacter sp. NFXS35]|uniref:copper chaperone PCu(A)C n=1 Tax=Erythrobacter sp. NFXS35 TaxID=2818436 RepID=UPI0032DE9803